MLAACLRRLGRYEEAGQIYKKAMRFIRFNQGEDLVRSLFGVILLPMAQNRRMILNELEALRDNLLAYRNVSKGVERPLLDTFFDSSKQEWLFPRDAAVELRTRSFFKRFEVEELAQYLPHMVVKSHRKGSFIFPDE